MATYGYDALERLTQVSRTGSQPLTESYAYDPQGRRLSKTSNGALTQYRYAGDALYADYGPSLASPRTLYLQGTGTDEPLLAIDPASPANRRYYHADGLGSLVAVTNPAGALAASRRYDSFGRVLASTGSLPTYGYSGREPDASGLVYYRARYYAPELGRFTQADPIALAGGINRYAYVGGSPVNFRDPSGLLGVGSVSPHIGGGSGGSGGKGPSGASSLSAYAGAAWDTVVSTVQAIGWKDAAHMALDGVATSETPFVSQGAGLLSAIWYGLEGDKVGAGTSLLGMAPLVGAAGDGARMVGWAKRVEEAGEETVRIRHYTSNKGINGIEESGVIMASDQNKVFAELARGKPLAARDVEATYGLKQGRGRNYVETDISADRVQKVYNPLTKSHELQIVGDVPLQNASFYRR